MKDLFKKAQSTTEYAILLAIIAASLVGMQIYIKRGIQGRIRDLADQINPTHYEQNETVSTYTTTQTGTTVQEYQHGIARTYQDGTDEGNKSRAETITRSGHETVTPKEEE